MKSYTLEEKEKAIAAVPVQVRGFLKSKTFTKLLSGIAEKNKLNLRQTGDVIEIVGNVLVGLELTNTFETTLHQQLPELSSAVMRELVDDLNDRVFKEAQRRLRENILEPETPWNEKELGPKDRYVEPMNDSKLHELAEKERAEGQDKTKIIEDTGPEESGITGLTSPQEETAIKTQPSLVAPQSIAAQKIGAPLTSKPTEVSAVSEPATGAIAPQARPRDGVDPYREPLE